VTNDRNAPALDPFERWMVRQNVQEAKKEGSAAVVAVLRARGYGRVADAVEAELQFDHDEITDCWIEPGAGTTAALWISVGTDDRLLGRYVTEEAAREEAAGLGTTGWDPYVREDY